MGEQLPLLEVGEGPDHDPRLVEVPEPAAPAQLFRSLTDPACPLCKAVAVAPYTYRGPRCRCGAAERKGAR